MLMFELARRLTRLHPITVLTSVDGSRQMKALGINGVDLRILGGESPTISVSRAYLRRVATAPMAIRRILRQRRLEGYSNTVISASPFLPDLAASLAAKAAGAKWVQSWQLDIPRPTVGYARRTHGARFSPEHLLSTVRTSLSWVSQMVALAAARRWCQTLMVPTHDMAARAHARGFDPDRILTVGYGVDFHAIRNIVTPAGLPYYDCVFVGRFHAQKGLEDLVAIWRKVLRRLPSARLAVIGGGSGPEAARFVSGLDEFDQERVRRLGVLTGSDKYLALAKARVFVFPSHRESWGHVVIEAMAVGLPVVGYDIPSTREAFGDAVLTAPKGDIAAFADSVVSLLSDPNLHSCYQERGLSLAATQDWDEVARIVSSRVWPN